MRYEPNRQELKFSDYADKRYTNQETSLFDKLKSIKIGTCLFKVYAKRCPDCDEQHIANVMLRSQLLNSKWGDKNMYFKHQRFDDDVRYFPEWATTVVNAGTAINGPGVLEIRPYENKVRSICPFAWFFDEL